MSDDHGSWIQVLLVHCLSQQYGLPPPQPVSRNQVFEAAFDIQALFSTFHLEYYVYRVGHQRHFFIPSMSDDFPRSPSFQV